MGEAKFTPGPWDWDDTPWDYDPDLQAPWVVEVSTGNPVLSGQIKCNKADAHLIAAAPELYAALNKSLAFAAAWAGKYAAEHELGGVHPAHQETIDEMQAALAKARGE